MPDITIAGLTAATTATGAMELEVNDAGTSKKVTVAKLQDAVIGSAAVGLVARTGANAVAQRVIAPGNGIAVTNGNGVDGDPTILVNFATQVEAEAGSNTAKVASPLRVAQQTTARLATQVEAEAGTDTSKLMTPVRTKQAIAALASLGSSVVLQTFTTSGTFTKEADDLAYFVECIGGGGGGGAGGSSYAMGGFPGVPRSCWVMPADIGATVGITVGSGGVSTLVGDKPGAGTNGGASSFGNIVSGPGGLGSPTASTTTYQIVYNEMGEQSYVGENGPASVAPGRVTHPSTADISAMTTEIPTMGACRYSSGITRAPPMSRRYGRGGLTLGANGSAPGGGGAAAASGNGLLGGSGARGEVRIHRFKS